MSTTIRDRSLPFTGSLAGAAPEVRVLVRFLGVMLFVTAALSIHLYTRTRVVDTALALDQARSELARSQTQHDRLLVERTMLRSPSRLGAVAVGMGLEAPARVVDVAP